MADTASLVKYFAPPKSISTPLKVLGAGALIFLIGLGAGAVAILLGLVVMAAGGYWIYTIKATTRLADSDVQGVIDRAAEPARADAFKRFGLIEESLIADPVVLAGPNFRGLARKGDDGEWRTSKNFVNVLLFTEKSVHLYTHKYDITKPEDKSGSTEEYFYKHIVSVSTSEEEFTVGLGDQKTQIRKDTLLLRNSGGEPISLTAYNSQQLNSAVSSARSVIAEKQD